MIGSRSQIAEAPLESLSKFSQRPWFASSPRSFLAFAILSLTSDSPKEGFQVKNLPLCEMLLSLTNHSIRNAFHVISSWRCLSFGSVPWAEFCCSNERSVRFKSFVLFCFWMAVEFRQSEVDHHYLTWSRSQADCQIVFFDFKKIFDQSFYLVWCLDGWDPCCGHVQLLSLENQHNEKEAVRKPSWSIICRTVFSLKLLEQKLKRDSSVGPTKSITK